MIKNRLRRNRWRFSTILWCSLILMLIIPGILNLMIFTTKFNQILSSNVTSKSLEMLEQTSNAVESEVQNILFTIGSIAYDHEIISIASVIHANASTFTPSGTEMNLLDSYLRKYFHYNTYPLKSVIFFYKDRGMYVDMYQDSKDLGITEEQFRSMPWYDKTKKSDNKIQIFGIEENDAMIHNGHHYITVSIAPNGSSEYYGVEEIYFIFDASLLNDKLRSEVANAGNLYILDAAGSIIADRQAIRQDKSVYMQEKKRNDRGYFISNNQLVVYITSQKGWSYIQVIPYDTISQSSRKILFNILVIGVGSLLIFLFICIFLVRSINKPVLRLVNHMNMVKRGDFNTAIVEEGPLEIYVLGNTFNHMVKRIRDLLKEMEGKEKQKTQAEIAALQSQINPHFLLNTLNCIKIMAAVSKTENIKLMTESLTKLLAASFYREGMFAKIEEEIDLIRNYVHIMKVRFGDTFDLVCDIEPDIHQLFILKLLLQPIVENAIIHGLHEIESRGVVRIEAKKMERFIRFRISDNGKGIDTEILNSLERAMQEKKHHFSGIGIGNVMQRIELNYGREYGVKICSNPEEGTQVEIIVPILESVDTLEGDMT